MTDMKIGDKIYIITSKTTKPDVPTAFERDGYRYELASEHYLERYIETGYIVGKIEYNIIGPKNRIEKHLTVFPVFDDCDYFFVTNEDHEYGDPIQKLEGYTVFYHTLEEAEKHLKHS